MAGGSLAPDSFVVSGHSSVPPLRDRRSRRYVSRAPTVLDPPEGSDRPLSAAGPANRAY
jgi:hypothetical protein